MAAASQPDPTLATNFCPDCGSPAVDASSLVGGVATCRTCKWEGVREDLLVHQAATDFTSREAVFTEFFRAINLLLAPHAVEYARFLVRWGFLPAVPTPEQLQRYLVAIAKGIAVGVVKEREIDERRRHPVPPRVPVGDPHG